MNNLPQVKQGCKDYIGYLDLVPICLSVFLHLAPSERVWWRKM